MTLRTLPASLPGLLLLAASACTGVTGTSGGPYDYGYTSGGSPNLGATPGGTQDIGHARAVIAAGGVPTVDDVTVEGLLSEHDLPASGAPCDDLMCLRPAVARAPSLMTGQTQTWLHLGMTSGLPASSFQRPPLDVMVVVDKSGAMSIDWEETRAAIFKLIDQLGSQDRLGILAFDQDLYPVKDLGPVGDAEAIKQALRAVNAEGGASFQDAATARAFSILQAQPNDPSRLRRVMVFGCGYPAINTEGTDPFSVAVHAGATARIGTSYFGVLLGWSPELSKLLSRERGGSLHFLQDVQAVSQVFDLDFDTMVTPVAYDLELGISAAPGYSLDRIYGIPADENGNPQPISHVATAFLSHRRGGIVYRLTRGADATEVLASGKLAYTPETALGFTGTHQEDISVNMLQAPPNSELPFYSSAGVHLSVVLVNMADVLRDALSKFNGGDKPGAGSQLDRLVTYLDHESTALNDDGLRTELALCRQLRANMDH